jgi:cytochrome c-type biogenesis protein CcmH/NrfG
MAGQLGRLLGVGWLMLVASGCTQTPTTPDTKPIDLDKVYGLAAEAYETLAQNAPEEAEPWFKLGNIYARTLRIELAIQCYREALVRDPRNVKAWHNMGVVQLRHAGKSFEEVELLVEPDNELHKKSVKIRESINALVN